jgi:hypothetical protein
MRGDVLTLRTHFGKLLTAGRTSVVSLSDGAPARRGNGSLVWARRAGQKATLLTSSDAVHVSKKGRATAERVGIFRRILAPFTSPLC